MANYHIKYGKKYSMNNLKISGPSRVGLAHSRGYPYTPGSGGGR
jgi:hypothetical protein